jgi:dephospho-CoA kinase
MKIAFITRHQPTDKQKQIVAAFGAEIITVGDVNGFDRNAVKEIVFNQINNGIRDFAVVNPAVALNIATFADEIGINIWIFENINRAKEGEKPTFDTTNVRKWTIFGDATFGVFLARPNIV